MALYGQREIAYARENKVKRKRIFLEIIIFRFITMFISILIYYFTYANHGEYQEYYQILILYLLAAAFDISWFFQGMEEFKKTVSRNVIVRIASVCAIFIFVKNEGDLSKYLLIYSLADLLGNLSLWLYLPKYLKGAEVKHLSIRRHMIPILLLFIPQIAVKLYNIVDKTMIGYMVADKTELGNYEEAYKVINVLFTVVSSLGVVMIPRIASVFATGNRKKVNEYLIKSFQFTFLLAFPMMMGIITISKEFVPIFLGEGYEKAAMIINLLAPMIVLMRYYQCNWDTIYVANKETKRIYHFDISRIISKYYIKFFVNSRFYILWSSNCNHYITGSCGTGTGRLCKKTD